jgi:PAS domain S-box-containing protein
MINLPSLSLSITLLLLGLIFYILYPSLLSIVRQAKRKDTFRQNLLSKMHLPNHYEAYFLVESGGKVVYANPMVRELFGLNGKKTNLEVLGANIQPRESFFALCSQEGKARFNLGKRLIEGKSYSLPHNSTEAMLVSFRNVDLGDYSQYGFKHSQSGAFVPGKTNDSTSPSHSGHIEVKTNQVPGFDHELVAPEELEIRVQERMQKLQMEHLRTEMLLRIMTELSSSLDFDQTLQNTLEVIKDVIGASHATCMVLQPGKDKLRHIATVGYSNTPPPGGVPSILTMKQGLVGWIMSNRQAVLIDDVLQDERWIQLPHTWYHHRSAIGAPIIIGDQLLGVLLLYYPEVGHFSEEQLDLIQAAANQMAVAIKNTQLFHLTREQKDELSSLLRDQRIETSRSRSILEAIADGVLVTDQRGEITLFNHSAERMLDLKRAEVIGQSIDHFSGFFGGVASAWMDTIKSWMEEPVSFNPLNTFSEQVSLKTGRVISVNLAPVMNNDELHGTVSVFRDISHLIEVDRLKSEFVATVSHELRTPMTSIKGYVDILLMGVAGDLTEQQLRFLSVVQDNTQRLTILVNDLLDLSRIEAGQVNLSLQPLDLNDLVTDVLKDIQSLSVAEEKPMQFNVEIPIGLPRITGDPVRVRQILVNLLENAYNYTLPEGQISLQAKCIGEEIQIDIQDNGIGILPKEQDHIFERFYRGDNNLVITTSGTGLGLSIVNKLINMHNGRIWVQSTGIRGEGSKFSFTLPVYDFSQHSFSVSEDHAENLNR